MGESEIFFFLETIAALGLKVAGIQITQVVRLFSESLSSYCKKGILTVNLYCLFMYSNLNKILFTLKLLEAFS